MARFFKYSFLFILIACKKHGDPPEPDRLDCSSYYTYLSDDIKKINFKPGTYWILYDSITRVYDSILVTHSFQSLQEYPLITGQGCRRFADRISHKLYKYQYSSTASATFAFDQEFNMLESEGMETVINGSPNCYPLSCGTKIYNDYLSDSPQTVSYTKADSIFIYSKYYKRTINIKYPRNSVDTKKEYFFNSEIGFLKIRKFDTLDNLASNRVLVRSKIVR